MNEFQMRERQLQRTRDLFEAKRQRLLISAFAFTACVVIGFLVTWMAYQIR